MEQGTGNQSYMHKLLIPEAPHCVERKQCLYVMCHTVNSYFLNNKNCIVRILKMYFLAVSVSHSHALNVNLSPDPWEQDYKASRRFHLLTCNYMHVNMYFRLAMDRGESSDE